MFLRRRVPGSYEGPKKVVNWYSPPSLLKARNNNDGLVNFAHRSHSPLSPYRHPLPITMSSNSPISVGSASSDDVQILEEWDASYREMKAFKDALL